MPAAEVARRAASPRASSSRSSRCAVSTSRRSTSTSATCRSRACEGCSRKTGVEPDGDRRRHVLRLDVEGLRGLAGRAVDRASPRLRRMPMRSSTTTSPGDAGRAAAARATCSSPSPSCRTCSSSGPAASRTCSTTGTSARGSCSTSATARSPRCSSEDAERNELLGSHAITDGSFVAPREGRRRRQRRALHSRRRLRQYLDVDDPAAMKSGSMTMSLEELRRAAEAHSSAPELALGDVSFLCGST